MRKGFELHREERNSFRSRKPQTLWLQMRTVWLCAIMSFQTSHDAWFSCPRKNDLGPLLPARNPRPAILRSLTSGCRVGSSWSDYVLAPIARIRLFGHQATRCHPWSTLDQRPHSRDRCSSWRWDRLPSTRASHPTPSFRWEAVSAILDEHLTTESVAAAAISIKAEFFNKQITKAHPIKNRFFAFNWDYAFNPGALMRGLTVLTISLYGDPIVIVQVWEKSFMNARDNMWDSASSPRSQAKYNMTEQKFSRNLFFDDGIVCKERR